MFIRTKLLTVFLAITVSSILIVGFISFVITKNALMKTRLESLKSIADIKVNAIKSFFFERIADVRTVQGYYNIKTNLPVITRFAKDRTNPAYIAAKKMLDDQLKIFQEAYQYVDFMLVNPEGKIVYVTNDRHADADLDRPLDHVDIRSFEEGKKDIYFSEIYNSNTIKGHFEMLITAPIYDFNEIFIGEIAIQVEMEHIYNFIQDTIGLGKTGETLIGKDTGNSALFLNRLRHDKESALKRRASYSESTAFPMREAVKGRNGAGISVDYRGKEIIAAWRYIPVIEWGLVAKIDTTEAFASVKYLSNLLIMVLGLLMASVIVISFFIAKSFSKPIEILNRKTKLIADGDLTSRLNINSKDEIGILANSFNIMLNSLKEAQDELVRKEKFAVIGRISGSIAHDIRHPLATIKNSSYFLKIKLKESEGKIKKHLNLIDKKVVEANGIITALMRLSESKAPEKSRLNINEFVKEFFTEFPLPERIKLTIKLDNKCSDLLADHLQIRQVFANIVQNAVRAMPQDGILTVKTRFFQGKEYGALSSGPEGQRKKEDDSKFIGDFIEISFSDTGSGIKREILNKIFEPFCTTNNEGMGLGLSIVKDIIATNDGNISVKSEEGKGSTFIIIFQNLTRE